MERLKSPVAIEDRLLDSLSIGGSLSLYVSFSRFVPDHLLLASEQINSIFDAKILTTGSKSLVAYQFDRFQYGARGT